MDLCSINAVDLVILVTPTKKSASAISEVLPSKWREGVPRRYDIRSATECLAPGFDWAAILQQAGLIEEL